jgi:uncharacterized protein
MMDDHTMKNVLRKAILHSAGVCSIAFQGGEPILAGIDFFHRAVEYVRRLNQNNIRIEYALQTNGLNINEQWCHFFRENNILVGLSVDGTQEIHDKYRRTLSGHGTFCQAVKAAELFDRYGVAYNILTVVHRELARQIDEIYTFYKNRGWNYQQYIACLDPLYEKPGNREYSLPPLEYGKFLVALFNRWFEDLKVDKQPYIRQFENYIGILLGKGAEACDQRGVCGIHYAVEADGSVYPCDFYMIDEYKLGNMNDTAITVIDEKRKMLNFIEESVLSGGQCGQCEYYGICRGGCRRLRTHEHQNCFCAGYKLFFRECLPKMVQIADIIRSAAPGDRPPYDRQPKAAAFYFKKRWESLPGDYKGNNSNN